MGELFTKKADMPTRPQPVSIITSSRLDDFTVAYDAPGPVPHTIRKVGSVFRGMNDLHEAIAYAELVHAFFDRFVGHGCQKAYVVHGPTSTTRKPFEVVSATAGYRVAYSSTGRMADGPDFGRVRHTLLAGDGLDAPIESGALATHPVHGEVSIEFTDQSGWFMTPATQPGVHLPVCLRGLQLKPAASAAPSAVPPARTRMRMR